MSIQNGIHAKEDGFQKDDSYNLVNQNILEKTNDNATKAQIATRYGAISPSSSFNEVAYYDQAGSIFNQQLILVKQLKSTVDIRYKTDYFPRGGKNAGIPQSPHYVHTMDGKQEIIIQLARNYTIPPNPDFFLLEVVLLTVPRANQHNMHAYKFQLDHKDNTAPDMNPFFIPLTQKIWEDGEIRTKLVIVRTHRNELKDIKCLPVFGNQTSSDWTADCKSADDLKHTYKLNHAKIAFSLGFQNAEGEFVRFTNTTVISNEITEIQKGQAEDNVTCPNCSHNFSVREEKKKSKKRSIPASNATVKKRRPQRTDLAEEPHAALIQTYE